MNPRQIAEPIARVLAGALLALTFSSISPALAMEALSINPAWVPKNTPAISATATIRGIGFAPASTVAFDGVAATVVFVDSRTLTVQVPTSTVGKIARVVVTNPGGATDDLYPFIFTDKNIYVSATGSDANNGTGPATPKRTVAGALGVSAAVTNLILVTEGRYGDNTLGIPSGYVLAGGYDPTFTTRDPDARVSVIDSNQFGFNARSFGLDAKVVIDGLTFMDGLREGIGGAGIEFVGDQVVLSNSVIVGNNASSLGGALYINFSTAYGGRAQISNNVLIGNRSYGGPGGGIAIYPNYTLGNSLEVAISDNVIAGNRSYLSRGGGISVNTNSFYGYNQLNLKIVGNTIVGNSSKAGAGVDLNLSTHTDAVTLLANNNVIAFNKTTGENAGFNVAGLGMLDGTLTGSTLASNTASAGVGAGFTIGPSVSVSPTFAAKDLIIWGNQTDDHSGQMPLQFSDIGGGGVPGTGNVSIDPQFRRGLRGRFYLTQNDPNNVSSPVLDSGSDTAAATGADALTTSIDGTFDAGLVDMGAHFAPAPADSGLPIALSRLDPSSGDTFGTDWVLVRGSGFDPGARVNFGSSEANETVYISSQKILARPASHSAGTVDVTVTNPDATSDAIVGAYRYMDNYPPVWTTTVGLQAAASPLDCVRSVVLDWNEATDLTPPVDYDIYRFDCTAAPAGQSPPCTNWFDFLPGASNKVATTSQLSWIDTNFSASGSDLKFMYIVRASDSVNPVNREFNYAKRVALATKNVSDTTPPGAVGDSLDLPGGNVMNWAFARGALSYKVYRQGNASSYSNPPALTALITLNAANNDLDGDGQVDTAYTDNAIPVAGQTFFYKITAADPCGVETKNELLP
ncbi:MAG TPA: IPT/TIG domain-containing protein [Patescibacteria group bacterium]|nr:IPT/TIG domain-containing protein [Patescibacteria group bacterium]